MLEPNCAPVADVAPCASGRSGHAKIHRSVSHEFAHGHRSDAAEREENTQLSTSLRAFEPGERTALCIEIVASLHVTPLA